jgi:HK97 gp10 family phage protein
MQGDYQLQGLEEVLGRLKALEEEPRKKTTRFALRKAANLIRDRAKQNAAALDDPTTSNNIAANIAVQVDNKHFKRTGDLKMRVGVRGGAKGHAAAVGELRGAGSGNPGGDTFYWRFLEFGTSNMAARPFLRPAMDQQAGAASDTFVAEFDKAITRAIRRANRAKA